MATVPTVVDPKAADKAAKQLNVYVVNYVVRPLPGSPVAHKSATVVAHNDIEAGAWITRNAVLHKKQTNQDIQGQEQVVLPEQYSVEVIGMRTLFQDVEVAGSDTSPDSPPSKGWGKK